MLGQKRIVPVLGGTIPEISENFFLHMSNSLGSSKNSVLLIFDEIENISPKTAASSHWRDGNDTLYFWQTIRSFIQSEARGRLSLCIVSTSPRLLESPKLNGVANPVYLFAPKQFIPNLNFDETREMVERLGYFMGLEFPVETVSELQKDFGGHPFFIRRVCSKVHKLASPSRPLKVSRIALSNATREFRGQLEGYLREIIEQLRDDYPEEFDLMKAVVAGNRDDLTEFGREAPELIDHLIGYGLVERVGDDFDIRFDAIKTALKDLIKSDSIEDRWAEISRRRNSLESNIRIALFHWSKSVGQAIWQDVIENGIAKTRLNSIASTEPRVLFSRKDSPLYMTDHLLVLIKNAVVMPQLESRKSQIVAKIDVVNKYRKDAHAIIIGDEDMATVRAAFDYLEIEFSEP